MAITVYYGIVNNRAGFGFNEFGFEPEPTTKTIIDDLGLDPSTEASNIFRCPSFQGYIRNTYKVTATFDYNLTWDGTNITSTANDQNYFNEFVISRDVKKGCFSYLDPGLHLFADTDALEVELIPAIFEKKPIYKGITLPGEYDIANHFRKIEWAFVLSEPQTITINNGDPLYYIKFKTTEKIEFKRFYINDELKELQRSITSYRSLTNKTVPLTWYYNVVKKYYKKRFLKLIKQNLLD